MSFNATAPHRATTDGQLDPSACVLVEFKPKWLSQSPSAPKNAIRCRQCAMELRHLLKDLSWSRARPERKPCPLALLSDSVPREVGSPFRLAPHLRGQGNDERYKKALMRISKHPAIRELKMQQDLLDERGPLHARPGDADFVLAMTLRDCTCFCQIAPSGELAAIRFSDFDWKDPAIKIDRWRSAEQDLVDSGFYTAEWLCCGKTFYRPPTLCLLERNADSRRQAQGVIYIQDSDSSDAGADRKLDHRSNGSAVYSYTSDLAILERILSPFRAEGPIL